ncbi:MULTISPECIES: AAA family ATPase [unclassified Yoonia]|uniref:AAA family ATPase n=1 Tax=unclassified Yoonia TaxID=2629118 RepID=UPI002AFED75B|nr:MULTISPECIES: AAA family ATPase [unclassified Yoonia]
MTTMTLSTLRSSSAEELLARSFRERQPIIQPWLRTEESAVIWAASGVGKTMLCLSVALAVAGGGAVGDWDAPEPRKVLYIDGEMNIQDIKERIEILCATGGILTTKRKRTVALKNLTILARQDQNVGQPFYDLTDPDAQNEILRRVRVGKFELLILDNFTTLTDGLEDENASVAFKQVQDFFLNLKRMGIATILVHHSNKNGGAMRGSTALETTFEVIIGLKKPSISRPGQSSFIADFGKYRSKGDNRLAPRTWKLEEDGWNVNEELPENAEDDPYIKALKSGNYISAAEIGRALGVDRSTVKRRLDRYIAAGDLKATDPQTYYSRAKAMRHVDLDGLSYFSPVDEDETLDEAF